LRETIVREEETTRRWVRSFRAHGGRLMLARDGLAWQKSGSGRKEPIRLGLARAWFGLGPRRPNYLILIYAPVYGILSELWSGGFRRTLEVRTTEETYWFAVKDPAAWLGDIAANGGRIISEETSAAKGPTPS
jgi:hypothetical protein